MPVQAIPLFEEFYLLKRTMLEALGDYAITYHTLFYQGYSDGILAGCELTTTDTEIILHKGVILLDEQVFLIKEPLSVEYQPTNDTTYLNIRFADEIRDADFIYRNIDMVLTSKEAKWHGELELCRFKLQEGARLRDKYQDFEDRSTEFDTLQTMYAPYAALGESTLSSQITRHFAEEMLTHGQLSDLDTSVCIQLLQQDRPMRKAALKAYLERRGDTELKDLSNMGIYKELLHVVREGKGMGKKERKSTKKKWQMMVD